MKINLKDPRVDEAIKFVKNKHNITSDKSLYEIFKKNYHCEILQESEDVFCVNRYLYIIEEKYSTWFVLQFGEGK